MSTVPFEPSKPDFPCNSVDKRRLAFLLSRLSAKELTFADIKKKCATATGKVMQFNAENLQAALEGLRQREWVSLKENGRKEKFQLTPSGFKLLQSLRIYQPPEKSAYLEPPCEDAARHENRSASILLHLFKTKESRQTRKQANDCKSIPGSKALGLKPSIAQLIRQELIEAGFISWEPLNTQERYSITDAGLVHSTTRSFSFLPSIQMKLTGEQLTKLLGSARKVEGQIAPSQFVTPPLVVDTPPTLPKSDEFEQAILTFYENLRREKYFRTNAVPIYEVRNEIRQRFGEKAGSHEALDPAILKLRREGRFRLIAMTLSHDTPQQHLLDSIPGYDETLFYMEATA